MKRSFIITAISILALASCARQNTAGLNDDASLFFESWISHNYPAAARTTLGAYVLEETAGTGDPVGDSIFVRLNYNSHTLDGNLSASTSAALARQNGNYSKTSYYGPVVAYRGEEFENLPAGVEEAISTMKKGGRKKVAIPGWLSQSERYSNPDDYLKKCSGTDKIYELEIVDAFSDVERWEKDSLARFIAANYPAAAEDEIGGFYYVSLIPGDQSKTFPSDTAVYINYTGRLLNGMVFDTSIADTAAVWKLSSSSSSYGPKRINWFDEDGGKDYTSITMGDSDSSTSLIEGFSYALSKMHPYEKGICFFWSGLGYSYSGQGSSIPAYSPLCFEIELTDNE
jgi:FKBP-type peptidyl-prolyl cis-trans isomerase